VLTRREHSRAELCQKLQAKGFEAQAVTEVIDDLARQGWQSDARFTEAFIRQRIRDGYGPLRIAYELRQRGINSAAIMDAIIEDLAGGWDELMARIYAEKYPEGRQITRNEWARRVRFLQQRGFSYEMVRALFKRLDLKIMQGG
jgi:regulatory protein